MTRKIDDVVKAIVDLQMRIAELTNEEKMLAGEMAGAAFRRNCILTGFNFSNSEAYQHCVIEAGPFKLQIISDPELMPIPF